MLAEPRRRRLLQLCWDSERSVGQLHGQSALPRHAARRHGVRQLIKRNEPAVFPLNGVIPISGAKNAALPLMIASLLTDRKLTLENVPDLADVGSRLVGRV